MKSRIVFVLVLAVLLTVALTGTALAWTHGRGAAPILDHYAVVGAPINDTWYPVNLYWSTDGAKPLYACYALPDGWGMTKITHSDLVAGYKSVLVPRTATGVYLETRRGDQSNVLTISLP